MYYMEFCRRAFTFYMSVMLIQRNKKNGSETLIGIDDNTVKKAPQINKWCNSNEMEKNNI